MRQSAPAAEHRHHHRSVPHNKRKSSDRKFVNELFDSHSILPWPTHRSVRARSNCWFAVRLIFGYCHFQNIDARIYNSAENIVPTCRTASRWNQRQTKIKPARAWGLCVQQPTKKKKNVEKNGKSSISCSWMGHGPPIAHAELAHPAAILASHWSLCAILVCAVGHVVNRLLGISWHSCCCRPEVQCSNQCTGPYHSIKYILRT